jgi:trimeric autotransporter adhesin
MTGTSRIVASLACFLVGTAAFAQVNCQSQWTPHVFTTGGVGGSVYASCTYDDGTGTVYIGGLFQTAGGLPAANIASWNGVWWSTLGAGVSGSVFALAVYDDGTGPALYATGNFTSAGGIPANGIAKFNGAAWAALGTGLTGAPPGAGVGPTGYALAVYDDGSGPALYVGGAFTAAGGNAAANVAKWNGSWSAVGLGTSHTVRTLLAADAGDGVGLFAGGAFDHAGGVQANRVARWSGSAWSALGSGLAVTNWPSDYSQAFTLAAWDDGTGPALYVGGVFDTAGGGTANNVARFRAGVWSPLAEGSVSAVLGLATFSDSSGTALVATNTVSPNSYPGSNLRKWDGTAWSTVSPFVSGTFSSLTKIPGASGDRLVVGGTFSVPGLTTGVVLWNGAWHSVGPGAGSVNGVVRALHAFDDGGGPALYVGGSFSLAGGITTGGIARWNGEWSPVAGGLGLVYAFTTFDSGSGPELYAAGNLSAVNAAGAQLNGVARLTPAGWVPLGQGISGDVNALAVYDDGGGPALYAAGYFNSAGGAPANNIAKWDGTAWSTLGSGITGIGASVSALVVHDDGTGPALYAGGPFGVAGGAPAVGLARWNGTAWSSVGELGGPVTALATFDEGSGPKLFAGGFFPGLGNPGAAQIARWTGSAWSSVGGGLTFQLGNQGVFTMRVHDDGAGPALHVAGSFGAAGGVVANNVARWNGVAWTSLATGSATPVRASAVLDLGTGPAMFFGGEFTSLNGISAERLARWAPRRPALTMSQVGSDVLVSGTDLIVGHEYYNVFSLEPAPGGPGTGPYLGLWTSDIGILLQQVVLPVGSLPFHFLAASSAHAFGPYPLPFGTVVEGVCFDFTGGLLGCASTVGSITVQ